RQADWFAGPIEEEVDFLDRFVIGGGGGHQDAAVGLRRLGQRQRRRSRLGEQLAVWRGRLRKVLVLHLLRVSKRIDDEALDGREVGRNIRRGEKTVGGADPHRLPPVVVPGGRRAGNEPVGEGRGAAHGGQQPAGKANV